MVVCGPASKVGPRPFRPQVISMQQLSQIDWGFHSAPISTALSILTLLLNTLVQVSGVPRWTPIYNFVRGTRAASDSIDNLRTNPRDTAIEKRLSFP